MHTPALLRRAAIVAATVVSALLLAACGSSAVITVDASGFADEIRKPGVTVIDVRTPSEFASGHIAGATNIDWEGPDFNASIAKLDKTGTYAVYCHSGNRSGQATAAMADAGFTHVYNLDGGISMWRNAGFPVTITMS